MKKLFTFFAAALLATGMFAQTTEKNPSDPATVTADTDLSGASYTIPAAQVAGGGSKKIGDMWDKGVKVRTNKKHENISNALPFIVQEGKQINRIKIVGVANKDGVSTAFSSAIVDGVSMSISGTLPGKDGTASGTVEIANIAATESVIFVSDGNGGQALICYEIDYDDATPSTEPELSVNPTDVTFELTAAKTTDVANVTFKGKNLTPGTYSLTIPNLAGLSVAPTSVTVGADGKINEQVAITYTSDADVAAGSTQISLSIDNLEATVQVSYSASFEKNYLSQSVNIEQWVLDNGKQTEAFKAVLDAANIEYENINELDSLNDEKTARNEPYLGLKLKKEGARVACWLRQGDRIAVKFGALKDAVTIGVNGEYTELPAMDQSSYLDGTAVQDQYLEIITKSDKTIVIKQIMLNEDIAEVVLPEQVGVENIEADPKAAKRVVNGQVIIEKNGKRYNTLGTELK